MRTSSFVPLFLPLTVLAVLAGVGCVGPEEAGDPGRGGLTGAGSGPEAHQEEEQQQEEQRARLTAVPYLQGYRPARDEASVTVYEKGKAFEGLNLYVSGHAAEAVLMDMEGEVLHRWRRPLRRVWPDLEPSPQLESLEYWRRAYLYPSGELLAIFETLGLVKLDQDSALLWAYRSDVHHDLFVTPEGEIWVLDRRPRHLKRLHPEKPVLEDLVTVLSPEGEVLRQLSVLAAFERSAYLSLVKDRPVRHGDVFHTNTLAPIPPGLDKVHPAFREGSLLISVLQLNTVAVLDPEEGRIAWALSGLWRKQHQPVLLDDGGLLVFDNLGPGGERSRAIEVDPLTHEERWSFGGREGQELYSRTLGSVQRLPNGNTLITESENGRAVEVTAEGKIVWEFHNPHRAGEEGELVATLFEVVRLPPEFPFQGREGPTTGARRAFLGAPGGGEALLGKESRGPEASGDKPLD